MALKEKLQRLRHPEAGADASQRTAEWSAAVGQLFADVEQWLGDYIRDGLMVPSRRLLAVEEEGLGEYEVEELSFDLGRGEALLFLPVALQVAGARGRVDMYRRGHRQSAYRLLRVETGEVPSGEAWTWVIVAPRRQPEPRLPWDPVTHPLELNPDTLEAAIDSLLD